jgi:hypothetical protein
MGFPMSTIHRAICGLLIFCALTTTRAFADAEQTYEIKLHRPVKAGETCKMKWRWKHDYAEVWSERGRPVNRGEGHKSVELDGTARFLAVNPAGVPTKITVKVDRFFMDGVQAFPPGTEITGEWEKDGPVYRIDGKPPLPDAVNALKGMQLVAAPEHRDILDDFAGTKERHKVGDQWDIQIGKLWQPHELLGVPVDQKKVTGHALLKEVVNVNGVEVLAIWLVFATGDISGKADKGPNVDHGQMTARHEVYVPVDPSKHAIAYAFREGAESTGTDWIKGVPLNLKTHLVSFTSVAYLD